MSKDKEINYILVVSVIFYFLGVYLISVADFTNKQFLALLFIWTTAWTALSKCLVFDVRIERIWDMLALITGKLTGTTWRKEK